jgi:tetratricopeptide (TPR) repeat protein
MVNNARLDEAIRHQKAGRLMEAERIYQQILRDEPQNADALHLVGVLEGQRGNNDLAIERLRRSVELNPKLAAAWRNLGAILSVKGQFREKSAALEQLLQTNHGNLDAHPEVVAHFRADPNLQQAITVLNEAIRLRPEFAEAHNDLGNVLAAMNRTDEAIAAYSKAIKFAPQFANAHYGLGNMLSRKGNSENALVALERATALKPQFADAHLNMGNVLRHLGRREEAMAAYRRAIVANPNLAEPYLNIAQAMSAAGGFEQALVEYSKAIRVKPDYAKAHLMMAVVLAELNRFAEARASQARGANLAPDSAEAIATLGEIVVREHGAAEAEAYFRRAIEIDPNLLASWNGLGNALQSLGRFDEASACFRHLMKLAPDFAAGFGYMNLSYNGPSPLDSTELERLSVAVDDVNSPVEHRIASGFALGRMLDEAGHYDEAFTAFEKGNDLCKKLRASSGDVYDPEAQRRWTDGTISMFDAPYFNRRQDWGARSELPVFLVGMPRSGTTLVHQIAARHPQVRGIGERLEILQISQKLKSLDDPQAVQLAANGHIEHLRAMNATASRFVDKMPTNVKMLGLIAVLFPNARVILCRRDACDTCLSCYMQWFATGNTFSYDLAHCGMEHNEVDRLAKHWLSVLPLKILEVHYEELVADLEGQSRRLIDFLGLTWDPACLEFQRADTTVLTSSVWQVRQPIYQSSVGRWRHYERHLGPLSDILKKKNA